MSNKAPQQEKIELPPTPPIDEAELQRRRELFKRTERLRKEIGPIDIPVYELVREGRGDDDEECE